MAIGDWHTFGSYTFRETLHGPMVWGQCVQCQKPVLVVGSGDPQDQFSKDPRCEVCWKLHHGLMT